MAVAWERRGQAAGSASSASSASSSSQHEAARHGGEAAENRANVSLDLTLGDGDGRRVDQLMSMSMPERDSIHRAGGSPWGVGLLLVLLIVMVSYQSNFREKWFAL
ncbi:hypothetical protein TRIUR3_24345 [Triticum urartu]|uniref:Uncharacterized protein n=2 Tax=Triticum TaxID=4564 RepID=A0A9R0TSM3_TRITD|nr:hypothetical protein TRIUR3_24345 [Triticum urartu]VAI18178.1 unnamed protein product [Triticum turgidum subsp. durum]